MAKGALNIAADNTLGVGIYIGDKIVAATGLSKNEPEALTKVKNWLPNFQNNLNRVSTVGEVVVAAASDRRAFASAVKQAVVDEWKPMLDKGQHARFAGHVATNIGLLFVGTKQLNQIAGLAKAAKAAKAAEEAAELARFANAARVPQNVLATPTRAARSAQPIFETILSRRPMGE